MMHLYVCIGISFEMVEKRRLSGQTKETVMPTYHVHIIMITEDILTSHPKIT